MVAVLSSNFKNAVVFYDRALLSLWFLQTRTRINLGVIYSKVVRPGPARPVQPEKLGTGPGTGPVEPEKSGRAKNRDKTGHPSVEPITRPTRCRVTRFLLLFFSLL